MVDAGRDCPTPPPIKLLHVSHNDKTWDSDTSLKKIEEIFKSYDASLEFC